MPKNKPSPETDATIISLYLSGKNTYQTAQEFGSSQTFVINTLKRHQVPRRSTYSYTTKYIPKEKFFVLIDCEEKAYVLGFMYADGNNYTRKGKYEISLGLQAEDKEILEKIRDLISPQSKLKFKNLSKNHENWQDQYKLKFYSKLVSQQLIKLGCVPAKSLILTFPEWLIDPILQKHFIRGYFDGDGSLYAEQSKQNGHIDWKWQITSTNNFCDIVKQIIEQKVDVHCSQRVTKTDPDNLITSVLSIGGNLQVQKILAWIYQDATIYMQRKYNKYQEFLQYLNLKD